MFKDKNYAAEYVKELVKSTYYTQRKEINKGTSILKLCQEWPFLFQEAGMAGYFQRLTGIGLTEAFFTNLDKKGERILNFLKTVSAQKQNKFWSLSSSYKLTKVSPVVVQRWYFLYLLLLVRKKIICSTMLRR